MFRRHFVAVPVNFTAAFFIFTGWFRGRTLRVVHMRARDIWTYPHSKYMYVCNHRERERERKRKRERGVQLMIFLDVSSRCCILTSLLRVFFLVRPSHCLSSSVTFEGLLLPLFAIRVLFIARSFRREYGNVCVLEGHASGTYVPFMFRDLRVSRCWGKVCAIVVRSLLAPTARLTSSFSVFFGSACGQIAF